MKRISRKNTLLMKRKSLKLCLSILPFTLAWSARRTISNNLLIKNWNLPRNVFFFCLRSFFRDWIEKRLRRIRPERIKSHEVTVCLLSLTQTMNQINFKNNFMYCLSCFFSSDRESNNLYVYFVDYAGYSIRLC